MSLAQILADHSRDITASITHTNEMAQDNADRKANDLEEKFQHAKDTIEGLGGEIAGFGGAWHLGRKIYNKYKARQSQFNQDRESSAQDNTSETDKAQGGEEPKPDPEDKPGTAPKQGEDDPIESEDTFFPGEGGSEEADAIFSGAKAPTPPSEQVIDKPDVPLSRQQRALQPDAESAPDPVQGGDADARVADTDTQPLGDLQRNVQAEADAPAQPENLGREGSVLQESGDAPHQSAQDGSTPEATTQGDDQSAPKPGGDEVDGVNLDSGAHSGSGVGGAVDQEAGDLGESGGKGLADLGDTLARKVGTKIAGAGGDALSAGLDAASTALDFLGPIGEGIGLITSLVGLFEGLGHKKKDTDETGEQAEAETGTATAGVDTQALQKEELQNVPVGTAV